MTEREASGGGRLIRRGVLVAAASLGVVVAVAVAAAVVAGSQADAAGWMSPAKRGWFGHRGHFGHRGDHAEFAVEWVLRRVDASDEQQAEARRIVGGVMGELEPLHEQHRAQRDKMIELLSADEVDRAALEDLRAETIAMADEITQQFTTAIADLADVLEPEQRRELLEHVRSHRHHRRGHGHF